MLTRKLQVFLATPLLAVVFGLAGCGGGGGATGSATQPTTPTAPPAASVTLTSSAASIKADGTTTTTITATVVDANNLAVPNATVKFTATSGQFGASSGVSSSGGLVLVNYTALSSSGTVNPTDRTETITASVVGTSVTAQIPIKVTTTAPAPTTTAVILSSSTAAVKPDGSTTTIITATVVDANNLPVSDATVKFTASSGQLGASSGVSTSGGIVTVNYSALSSSGTINPNDRSETITATVVGTSVTAQIPIKVTTITPAPSASVVILSSSLGTVKPDGSTTTMITATVVDVNNLPVPDATVKFAATSGQFGASSGPSSSAGVVLVNYSALSSSGIVNPNDRTETITATVAGTSVTAQIPIKVTSVSGPAPAAVLLSSSAFPNAIKADGSSSTTITATVVDANYLPVSGATVKFTAASGQLGASSGVSTSGGIVTVNYSALSSSGTINPTDRTETITATVVGTNVTAQIPIKVTNTLSAPVAASVVLSSSLASVKADGSSTTIITAMVVDANNLPVSGATVKFTATSGQLGASSGVSSTPGGMVTISYSALSALGTVYSSDRTETITATVVGTSVTGQIPVKVTASTLALSLSASVASIKTDGSNSTTITATVFDSSNLAVSGQNVKFTAPTGLLGISSGLSSAVGVVTIPFSATSTSGAGDRTNRTEIVTASIVGTSVTAQIPIQITGSTLTLASSQSIAQVGATVSLTATAKDAAAVGVNAQTIRFSIDSRSTGAATLSGATATTGSNGATSVTLTGAVAGNVIVNADWLNAAGNSTLTTSTTVAVTSAGISFAVTSPVTNPTSLTLSASQVISVSVPTSISGVTVASVRFATTLGTWTNPGPGKTSSKVPVANAVTETLTAGANSGNANVQIDALDSAGNVLATLNRLFALSSATGTQISLQPSVSTVAPSTGGTTNTATLTATVRDAANNTVGNAPVLFEIVNPTGSGEQISPVVAYTNSNGQAVATFTSGALSTVGGLQIKATVVGAIPAVTDTKTINVAGTSVSVTLGQANVITSTDTSTTYTLPMSVVVVSSTGGAVSGATVTLSAFPTRYYKGSRDAKCVPVATGIFTNEDVNENDILDPGEDTNGDGSITPPHAAAGTLPPTVVTNASGVGTFNLIYLKNYSNWIDSRIRAKVVVNGTEFVNELKFNLPASSVDTSPICTLPNSPFGL